MEAKEGLQGEVLGGGEARDLTSLRPYGRAREQAERCWKKMGGLETEETRKRRGGLGGGDECSGEACEEQWFGRRRL